MAGGALYVIADHRHWFDQPWWATAVIAAGLLVLVAGFGLDRVERRLRGTLAPWHPKLN